MYFPIGVGWVAVKILTTRKIPRNQDRSVFIMGQPKPLLGFFKGFLQTEFPNHIENVCMLFAKLVFMSEIISSMGEGSH